MGKFKEIIDSSTPTLVDFHATWCGPCKTMMPILDELKSEVGDQARIIKIDIDKNEKTAEHYGIRGVPTLILFKNGEIMWRKSGVHSVSDLNEVIQEHR